MVVRRILLPNSNLAGTELSLCCPPFKAAHQAARKR
jgi:hypothetical protein